MNGIPVLTLLTVLPLVGAAIALFSGKHARAVALLTGLAALALALVVWTQLPGDGSIGLVERGAWAPSLGIEYHLGVDGLGALMLVLSAIVTLMSLDAAHRVRHQQGLYFALVLMLEAGLFGTFHGAEFLSHWFLFLGIEPHSCVSFLIKLWGGAKRGPAATQFFVYTMAGSVALLVAVPGSVSIDRKHGFWSACSDGSGRIAATDGDRASGTGDAVAGNRRAGWICGEGAVGAVPHMAAGGV